jgi:hypothetical protein
MELQHVNVKLPVEGGAAPDLGRLLELFHGWIQRDAMAGELLIDVADYRHVAGGPGVLLVGHEGDYSLDLADGRPGLRYNRKAPLAGTNAERFAQAWGAAARACRLLEEAALRFSRTEAELWINDRALAPNTPATLQACRPELEAFFRAAFGHGEFRLEPQPDPRRLFGVRVTSARPFGI